MTRASRQIEQVVDAARDALKALRHLAGELDTLSDSENPCIGDDEEWTLRRYRIHADAMTAKTDSIWEWLSYLYEAAAWIEEEEKEQG